MKNSNETKTDFLITRINQNENYQTVDINKWAFEKIKGSNKEINILELCCGTGKQTDYLIRMFPNANISCLDISIEAINTVKNNFKNNSKQMKFYNMGIDDFFNKNKKEYDIIFCSYGLYYSSNIDFVLDKINISLSPTGKLIVMGPYGDNNKPLFDILLGLNVNIPSLVISSSSTFMFEKVLADTIRNFSETHIYTTQNNILWENIGSVMSYWKNSTFFDAVVELEFQKIVES